MKALNTITLLLILLILPVFCIAQDKKAGDLMRSNGRIYVVVAVMITILFGLILYIVHLDRKIAKLEKENRL